MEKTVKLFAPAEYWETPDHILNELTGGCGPGGFGDALVPDTMYGLSVRVPCRIHDFMYAVGSTNEDKDAADRVLLNNLIRLIQAKTKSRLLKRLRMRRARTYYFFVHHFGGPAFWKGKNENSEERAVEV